MGVNSIILNTLRDYSINDGQYFSKNIIFTSFLVTGNYYSGFTVGGREPLTLSDPFESRVLPAACDSNAGFRMTTEVCCRTLNSKMLSEDC